MAAGCESGKTLPSVYLRRSILAVPDVDSGEGKDGMVIVVFAIAMFIALFGWGSSFFGWSDSDGKVQLALAASFILGALTGFKSKGD